MKKDNKNNYYNSEDQVNFEKLDNFKKYNSNFKNKTQYKNQNIKYSNSDKNYFNSIIKTEKNISLLNETDIKKDINYYNSSDSQKFEQLNNFPEYKFCELAIFNVREFDGSENLTTVKECKVRKSLYSLHFEDAPRVCDLGYLNLLDTRKDSFKRIEEVCIEFLQNHL